MSRPGIVGEYRQLADDAEADLLAMQVGDFYEFFGDNAELVARELDLQLTEKRSDGDTHPMAGVPVSELEAHVARLVERGYRVAVADQHETTDGHHRELSRIVTPGTSLDVDDASARYLAAIVSDPEDTRYGLAFADVRTGKFRVTAVPTESQAIGECDRFDPVELLPDPHLRETDLPDRIADRTGATVTVIDRDRFAPGRSTHVLRERYGDTVLQSVGLEPSGLRAQAAGALVDYVAETNPGVSASLTRLRAYQPDDGVALDATTRFNLELTRPMRNGTTLLEAVDHTVTAAGRRLLSERLLRPIRDLPELNRRLDAVEALTEAPLAREAIRDVLEETRDLARLASQAASGTATPRDLAAIRDALATAPELRTIVEQSPELSDSAVADILGMYDRDAATDIRSTLATALVDEPPGSPTDHGVFQRGYDPELDDVAARHDELRSYFEELGERERERLGVTHLQVDRNKTDGYYIQLGNSETDRAPDEYREIKQLKNSRRYTTDELESKEREMLRVEERRSELERQQFRELRENIGENAAVLQRVGRAFAALDLSASLGVHAVENGWRRPDLHGGNGISIAAGRHPVVEQTVEFVPNDAVLGTSESEADPGARSTASPRIVLVTGPNMSGKSTYLRQVALIVLLAQVGSFVPADSARIGLVDGIYTRVGALDELASGRSTFMVEMQELSKILHRASEESLVILDEVGRGTATYDGISIAWAATEYLHNEVNALTLFATHYHELTSLGEHLPRIANVHVAAEESGGEVTFLHSVESGPTDRSYGIHVAELAGVPDPVVERATDVLERLRSEQAIEARGAGTEADTVQAIFDLEAGAFRGAATADGGAPDTQPDAHDAVLRDIQATELETLTPAELMNRVESWQRQLEE